jgi:hypothetical protein
MTLSQQQQVPELGISTMTKSPEIDWKQRYEQLQLEHQLELERIRLHYDHELKEKVTGNYHQIEYRRVFFFSLEIRIRLKREYDHHFAEFRAHLLEQQQQQLENIISRSPNLDQSIGEQVREQVRIAQEYDRYEDEQRQQLLSQKSTDNDELKPLVNKLHTEGK